MLYLNVFKYNRDIDDVVGYWDSMTDNIFV